MAYRVPGGEQPERKFPRMRPSGEEEEEEESGPSSPISYRRPGPPTASPFRGGFEPGREIYQRSSYGEPDIPELFEILVPEGELRDPEFRYSSLWETTSPSWFLPRPGERGYSRGGGGEAQRDVARGGGGPRPGPAPAAGPGQRPARRREGPPTVDPRNWFDVDAIWNGVRQRKADQRFRPGAPVGIVQIAPASADEMSRARDLVRFFRIPKAEADKHPGRAIWDSLLHPFMDELSYAFNHGKPRDIPGTIGFQAGRDGSFWLGYME